MLSCQNSAKFDVPTSPSCSPVGDSLRAQQRRVIAWTGLYAFAAGGLLLPIAALMYIRFSEWVKSLPNGIEPSIARLMADRVEVLALSCLGGALGVAFSVAGTVAWPVLMGRGNSPSKKVVLIIGGLPVALGFVGTVMVVAGSGKLGLVAAPLMIGATFALVPVLIGIMAIGLLNLARNVVGQTPLACNEETLPPLVADYFDNFNSAADEANLEFAGNFCFVPKRMKYRRTWLAPNGAYFVDATELTMGNTSIRALCVTSATDDGHFFSTTDLGQPTLPRDSGIEHHRQFPGAPLAELIERHIETIGDWTEQTGSRPLIFDASEQHALFEYGLAAHMRNEFNELFWIGNPYRGQPLPPLPGKAWQAEIVS